MLFKTSVIYIFLFIISYFCEGHLLSQVYAASIPPTEKLNTIKDEQPINKHLNSSRTTNNTVNFIQLSNFTYSPKISNSSNISRSPPILYTNLYEQGKSFFITNNDNEILQNSLTLFSQSKQFIKETDLMLHDLSENILTSLNIDNPNHKDLFSQQDPQSLTGFNTKNYGQRIKRSKSQHFYSEDDYNYSNQTLYNLIFNKQNLYYLITLVFFIYVIKKIINLMFLKKQYDSQNRR